MKRHFWLQSLNTCRNSGLWLFLGFLFLASQRTYAFPAKFGLSPDNSRQLLISTILSAQHELLINVYQFDVPEVKDAIISQIKEGVEVQILIEGQPVGNISTAEDDVLTQIIRAMNHAGRSNHLFMMTAEASNTAQKRRFVFDHAKYIVVDSKRALITSENFTSTGHPAGGEVGNRGWETVLESAKIAKTLSDIFYSDSELSHGDVEELTGPGSVKSGAPSHDSPNRHRHVPSVAQGAGDVSAAKLITSPDSVSGIVSLIGSARKHLEMEQMSLPSTWKDNNSDSQSPIVTALIEAARKGVQVRVLLNDDTVFGGHPNHPATGSANKKKANELTVELLTSTADCEGIPLAARIVSVKDVDISYIHNKGIIVDGKRVLVSSINGTRNAVMNNREVGIQLESVDGAKYFGGVFDFDWASSAKKSRPLGEESAGSFNSLRCGKRPHNLIPNDLTPGMMF